MDITINNDMDNRILIINGDVDASSSILVDDEIRKAIDEEIKHILVDCRNLDYISSAGLGVFMSHLQEIESKGIQLSLYNMQEHVYKVFEILGLHNLIRIVKTKEDALI